MHPFQPERYQIHLPQVLVTPEEVRFVHSTQEAISTLRLNTIYLRRRVALILSTQSLYKHAGQASGPPIPAPGKENRGTTRRHRLFAGKDDESESIQIGLLA